MNLYDLSKKYLNPGSEMIQNKERFHFFFLSILSLNYILPLFFFGGITLFYLDALDSEIIINHVISQRFNSTFNPTEVFLNGNLPLEYMRRLHHPYMLLYTIFNTELAYWLVDIFVKLTSYFSFFILAKKFNKNFFLCALISCLYASINLPTYEGFGLAIFPYLFYLILFKDNLKIKHYFLIIFFGLNADFIFTAFALPVLTIALILFIKKNNFPNLIKILFIFTISLLLANWNLLYLNLQNIEFHRVEFVRDSLSFSQSIIFFFLNLFKIPTGGISYSFFINIAFIFFLLPLFVLGFLSNNYKVKKILFIIIIAALFQTILKIETVAHFVNKSDNILKTLSWDYISLSYNFLFCLALIQLLKKNKFSYKFLTLILFICTLFFQINSSIVPFYKNKILKINNYQNIYTFKGYYAYYDYPLIKDIVKNSRIISVGHDPLVAAFHGINISDGYHNLYPLSYKHKFRKIIEKQLEDKVEFKNYYDNYGSRLYTFLYGVSDPNNINLNYQEAKKLNVEYVLSKYKLQSDELKLIFGNCELNKFCLYKIR